MNHPSWFPCLLVIPFCTDSGLGHMSCFGQWAISKCDTSRSFISVCMLGLAFLEFSCHKRKFEQTRGELEVPQFISTVWDKLAPELTCHMLTNTCNPNWCHLNIICSRGQTVVHCSVDGSPGSRHLFILILSLATWQVLANGVWTDVIQAETSWGLPLGD